MFEGLFFLILGLILGSFANALIVRIPNKESLLTRSRCNQCKSKIFWYDNIPVVSWFLLKGKCRKCHSSISFRYPLVELLMAALFLISFKMIGLNWWLLEILILIFGMVVVTFIDFDHMILPDLFTLSGTVIGLGGAWLNPERDFMSAFLGAFLGGGFLWLTAYIYWLVKKQEGMGGGDIKLLAWIGSVLGLASIPFVILTSSISGSIVGLIIAYKTKGGLRTAIPYGPYLVLGAILYIIFGKNISEWYWNFFINDLSLLFKTSY